MSQDVPHFDDRGRLIAPRFDDVYFSAEDGLAETRHVFLEGNRLAERFAALRLGETFTIGETGFGTGLNFLAACQLFEQHAPADSHLQFVSVEGFPLDRPTIERALAPWPELAGQRAELLNQWGHFAPGVHRMEFACGSVSLSLLIGEVADVLSDLKVRVDAWFLDGFAPARNPAMWSEQVFQQVARLSQSQATLATYTAAGSVRRGLGQAGFEIEKRAGFGRKRDMTVGRFVSRAARREPVSPGEEQAVVIGGSLAGAFAARALAEQGIPVTVIERQRLSGHELPMLADRVAVLQPKISDIDDTAGRWLREGYGYALRLLSSDQALVDASGWRGCGAFHAAYDEKIERRLRKFVDQFGNAGLCRWFEPGQTLEVLGVSLAVGGVLIEGAGVLRPAGLCAGLLSHDNIRHIDQSPVVSLHRDGQAWSVRGECGELVRGHRVVIANALDALRFEQTRHLELRPVRGQVTAVDGGGSAGQAGRLTLLRRALFYGGYALPMMGGVQTIGASFVPGDTSLAWRDDEHAIVCDQLARVLPDEAERLRCLPHPSGWVGLRTTTPTHRCYAEQVEEGLYVSLGHGSHGIASAAGAGEVIADRIVGAR